MSGTDHNTANYIREKVGLKQKSLINALPDLTDLDEDDLKYKIDLKQVYATMSNETILEKQYDYLSFYNALRSL